MSDDEALLAEAKHLAEELRDLCHGHATVAIFTALDELYGRVLSGCIHDEAEMEKAIANHISHIRGWWLADRGGSFTVS
jgi:hypothetical protein